MTIPDLKTKIYTPSTIPPSLLPALFEMINRSFGIAPPFSNQRLAAPSDILSHPGFYGNTIKNWWIVYLHPADAPLTIVATMTLREDTNGVYNAHLLAVAPEYMGLGLGRKFFREWPEQFVGRRGGGLVKGETLRDYGCGGRFYEKCGYTVTREEEMEKGAFGSHMSYWVVFFERWVEAQEGKCEEEEEEVEGGKEGWVWEHDGKLVKVNARGGEKL